MLHKARLWESLLAEVEVVGFTSNGEARYKADSRSICDGLMGSGWLGWDEGSGAF